MEDRLLGEIELCGFRFSQAGELGSRPCQNVRGELALFEGDDLMGDPSALERLACGVSEAAMKKPCDTRRTLGKLGELRRRAMGLNSESGLLWMNDIFLLGEEPFVPFCTRRGGTVVCAPVSWSRWCLLCLADSQIALTWCFEGKAAVKSRW